MQMKFAFLIVITIVHWHLAESFGLLNLNLVILFQNFIKMKLYTYHDISSIGLSPWKKGHTLGFLYNQILKNFF